jgi:hypothetical protein
LSYRNESEVHASETQGPAEPVNGRPARFQQRETTRSKLEVPSCTAAASPACGLSAHATAAWVAGITAAGKADVGALASQPYRFNSSTRIKHAIAIAPKAIASSAV